MSRSLHHWAEVSHWEAQNRYPRICGDLCKSSILHRSYHDMEFLSKCRSTHVRVFVVFIMMHLCRRWAGKAQDSPLLEATLTPQSTASATGSPQFSHKLADRRRQCSPDYADLSSIDTLAILHLTPKFATCNGSQPEDFPHPRPISSRYSEWSPVRVLWCPLIHSLG